MKKARSQRGRLLAQNQDATGSGEECTEQSNLPVFLNGRVPGVGRGKSALGLKHKGLKPAAYGGKDIKAEGQRVNRRLDCEKREPKLTQSRLVVSPSCSRIRVQRGERVSQG